MSLISALPVSKFSFDSMTLILSDFCVQRHNIVSSMRVIFIMT